MNNFIQYLFELTLGSGVLFLGFLIFKKHLPLKFRRLYLIGCLILPLIIPHLSFNTADPEISVVPEKLSHVFVTAPIVDISIESTSIQPIETEESGHEETQSLTIPWKQIVIFVYSLVSLFLLIRFGLSIRAVLRLMNDQQIDENGNRFYLIENKRFTGGSFFKHIFINAFYLNDPALNIILTHEKIHSRLLHSLDILISELYCAVFWINPFAWFIKKEIQLNAEFEADLYAAETYNKDFYAQTLLHLSINTKNMGPLTSFSAVNIQNRIRYILNKRRHHWASSLSVLPFLVLIFWLVSCEPEMMDFTAMDPQAAMKNVKTVTTRYISHQKDTQQKDGKVIAIAYYLPDGTVDRVEQHMTYPYDYERPFKREFLISPNPTGVLHILDGFELGQGENNILYGHDWPKLYAQDVYSYKSELAHRTVDIKNNNIGLPESIIIQDEFDEEYYTYDRTNNKNQRITIKNRRYEQAFTYDNGKVASHSGNMPGKLLHDTFYKYEGENLSEVTRNQYGYGTPPSTKFEYEGDIMTKSSFFKNGKKYNYREFFYNSEGLKTRTEIYNVYGEPEYTIIYDYEYY
ncbi:MAG: M56 family metallopeptidase [Bacteroidota bacterium]